MTVDLKKLRELLAKAKATGDWQVSGVAIPYSPRQRSPFRDEGCGIVGRENVDEIIRGGSQDEQGGAVGILRNEDAALIVAAVNALPELLDALEAKVVAPPAPAAAKNVNFWDDALGTVPKQAHAAPGAKEPKAEL